MVQNLTIQQTLCKWQPRFTGFLEQLVELDNDLRQHRELGLPPKIILSTLEDRDSLPNPWNFEFWTQEVSVEDLGMPLVRLGEPHPMLINSTFSSVRTSTVPSRNISTVPSRNLSRKPSSSGDYAKGLSRRSSLGVSNSFRKSRYRSKLFDHLCFLLVLQDGSQYLTGPIFRSWEAVWYLDLSI